MELTCTIAKGQGSCFDVSYNPLSNNEKSDILITKVVTLDAHDYIAKHLRDAMLNLSPNNAFFLVMTSLHGQFSVIISLKKVEFAHFEIY